jgi:hypothetical protein
VVIADKVEDAHVQRVAKFLTRKLGTAPAGITHAVLRRDLAGRDRAHFDAAISRLLDAGQVVREDIDGQGSPGVRYRLDGGSR